MHWTQVRTRPLHSLLTSQMKTPTKIPYCRLDGLMCPSLWLKMHLPPSLDTTGHAASMGNDMHASMAPQLSITRPVLLHMCVHMAHTHAGIYGSYRNSAGQDCTRVGPSSKCFCGHLFRDHQFTSKRAPYPRCCSCSCQAFAFVPTR